MSIMKIDTSEFKAGTEILACSASLAQNPMKFFCEVIDMIVASDKNFSEFGEEKILNVYVCMCV